MTRSGAGSGEEAAERARARLAGMSEPATVTGWDRRRYALLAEYERIALELFAERGFGDVTVDEIAEAAGVSARTLYRYFPAKEDFLLALPRRGLAVELKAIAALEPSADPVNDAWAAIRGTFAAEAPDVEIMTLWRAAAADAPEVVDRVRGQRMQAVMDALTAYCERSLGVDAADDPRPRILAGMLMGVEFAVVEALTRSHLPFEDLADAAGTAVAALGRSRSVVARRRSPG